MSTSASRSASFYLVRLFTASLIIVAIAYLLAILTGQVDDFETILYRGIRLGLIFIELITLGGLILIFGFLGLAINFLNIFLSLIGLEIDELPLRDIVEFVDLFFQLIARKIFGITDLPSLTDAYDQWMAEHGGTA